MRLSSTQRWIVGTLITIAAIAIPLIVSFFNREQLQARGTCKEYDEFHEDGKRRNRYFIDVINAGREPIGGILISVDYWGGEKAEVRLEASFDEREDCSAKASTKTSMLISCQSPLPPAEKFSVHIGDIIANGTSNELPDLAVSVKSASEKIPITWNRIRNSVN